MDRDRRWDRTRLAYQAMVHGAGVTADDPVEAVRDAYRRGETDEFIKPLVLLRDGSPVARIHDGDGIFFVNYRSDRMRQIVAALCIETFSGFPVAGPAGGHRRLHDAIRPDFSPAAGLPAVFAGAHSGRGAQRR